MSYRTLLFQIGLALPTCAAFAQLQPPAAPAKTAAPEVAAQPVGSAPTDGEKTTAAVAAPDLVRLKDDSMLRGTIGELVANDHVTIVTVTGDTRRFNLTEVSYAGPADQAPPLVTTATKAQAQPISPSGASAERTRGRPAAGAAVNARFAQLHLSANVPNATYYVDAGLLRSEFTGYMSGYWTRHGELLFGEVNSSYYRRLCTAPCDTQMPEGRYTLALGVDDAIVASDEKLDIKGNLDVKGEYVDKSAWRTAGLLVLCGSVLTGLVMMLSSRVDDGPQPLWFVGAGIALVGGVAGGIMVAQRDRAYFEPSAVR